jgi:hypothetical protein
MIHYDWSLALYSLSPRCNISTVKPVPLIANHSDFCWLLFRYVGLPTIMSTKAYPRNYQATETRAALMHRHFD